MKNAELSQLVVKHGPALSRFCMSLCKNPHDASDLYQETWLRLMQSSYSYRDEKSFISYLFRISINLFRDRCRQKAKRQELSIDGDIQTYIENIPDKCAPDETYEKLYRAILSLSPDHRAVIALAYFDGLDLSACAGILRVPVGTVKSRLHRAKKLLKKELTNETE